MANRGGEIMKYHDMFERIFEELCLECNNGNDLCDYSNCRFARQFSELEGMCKEIERAADELHKDLQEDHSYGDYLVFMNL